MSSIVDPPVFQSGTVTPRHFAVFTTDGVIQDAGDPIAPFATSGIGIQSSNQTSINIVNGPITGPYSGLSFGITPTEANITIQNFNGGPQLPLNFVINGVVIPFPGPGVGPFVPLSGATMTGPGALILNADPVVALGAATKEYVDVTANGAAVSVAAATFNNIGRNFLHNPMFDIWQRGVGPFNTNSVLTADRWRMIFNLDTSTILQAVIGGLAGILGDEQAYAALGNTFTGNAGAASFTAIQQSIENVLRLAGKTVTISFYAQASGTQKFGASLDQNFGTGGSPSAGVFGAGQSVTLSGAWARYSLTFAVPSVAGKTLGTNGDHYTSLNLWYSSGTTNATRSGSVGVQSGVINLWGVQIEVGSAATSLEKIGPRYDMSNCERFYQLVGMSCRFVSTGIGFNAAVSVGFATMRAIPTAVSVSGGSVVNASAATPSFDTPRSGYFTVTAAAAGDCFVLSRVFALSADL